MILNENITKQNKKLTLAAVAVVALTLVILVSTYRPHFPWYWTVAVELVCGAILAVALGLCVNEETRFHGVLYSSLTILTPLLSIIHGALTGNPVTLDVLCVSYGIGFLVGGAYAFSSLRRGNPEKLGTLMRKLLKIVVAIICLIVVIYSVIIPLFEDVSAHGLPSSVSDVMPYLIPLISMGVALVILNIFLLKQKIGLDGSGIFVIGPPASGKTVLALALWREFRHQATTRPLPVLRGNHLMVKDVLRDLYFQWEENHILPRATAKTDVTTFELILRKLLFISVLWRIIDFPGEFLVRLTTMPEPKDGSEREEPDIDHYWDSLNTLKSELETVDGENTWSIERIQREAVTLDLLRHIQDEEQLSKRLYDYTNFRKPLITVITNASLQAAAKLVVLIDGEQLAAEWTMNEFTPSSDSPREKTYSISRTLEYYYRILRRLKEEGCGNKKVAFLVTKTDILCNQVLELRALISPENGVGRNYGLSEVLDDEELTEKLEQCIYTRLRTHYSTVFEDLERELSCDPLEKPQRMTDVGNWAEYLWKRCSRFGNSKPVHFIAFSVDAYAMAGDNPMPNANGQLSVFGIDKLREFGR